MTNPIIEVSELRNYLGGNWVHDGVNLTVQSGEILAIVGGSGSGKTTLLRCILMLQRQTAGDIKVFGIDTVAGSPKQTDSIRRRWGVLFQQSALFSSLTVLENVMFPLKEFTNLPKKLCQELAMLKIVMVGLPADASEKHPSELSGGMRKRAAAARALALDPELLFLDEPTSGLDPKSAEDIDDLMRNLRDTLGITIVMVTHDLMSLRRIADRVAFIGEGKILALQSPAELRENTNPAIHDFFNISETI